jgi:molybdopterin biosynthesis enzyme
MVAEYEPLQRIVRLTPLAAVRARIAAEVAPVPARTTELGAARGLVLAADVILQRDRPVVLTALRDGYAVAAELTADAGPFAPAPLPAPPPPVALGDALPAGTDAVAPIEAIVTRDGRAEAIVAVTAGDGVLQAGGDGRARDVLRRAGGRLRASDIAALAGLGLDAAEVRAPRVRVVSDSARNDRIIDACIALVTRAAKAAGSVPVTSGAGDLEAALRDEKGDAVIAVGGTGSGPRDKSAVTLARIGKVSAHGIAISPGETTAFGFVGTRPVLLVPGRVDAALAVWLLVGAPLLARLADATADDSSETVTLARKVTSTLGLVEVVPVRVNDGKAEPMAFGYWPHAAVAQADGWISVGAESEGFPAGTEVAVRAMP